MKKAIAIILILIFNPTYASLSNNITILKQKYNIKNADIGISVQQTSNGKQLYQDNALDDFTPASNNKLFTAIAALISLPSNFTFNTTIYTHSPLNLSQDVLNDNLYIKFTGDPSLTSSQLFKLLKKLKTKGIKKINGNIILVANQFTGSLYPDGWSKDDIQNCYAAPTSSMNLNKNCIVIAIVKSKGKNTEIKRISNTQNIKIINKVISQPYSSKKQCRIIPNMTSRNILYLNGCMKKYKEVRISLPVANPSLKTLNTVNDYLNDLKIKRTGNISIGNLPKNIIELTHVSSASLAMLLKHMLLHSDNLYAESIARSIGYNVSGSGNINIATKVIKEILTKNLRINTKPLVLKDGSGLSSLDKVSPQLLVNILTKIFNTPKLGNMLYKSLPQSGISGTLSYRMTKELQGKVRAKTGTLKGTITLSGYLITRNRNQLSFSIMINNLKKSQRISARDFQNSLLRVLYNTY